MKEKFENFKKKYLTLPWITLAVCVAILAVNIFKGPHKPQRAPKAPEAAKAKP
jgi:hypothetical protein